jgi:hypothetical protein
MDVSCFRDRQLKSESGIDSNFITSDRNGATLAVELRPGTKLGLPGLELFVVSGGLIVDGKPVGPLDYANLSQPAEVIEAGLAIAWVPRRASVVPARRIRC